MIVTDQRVVDLISSATGTVFMPPFTCMGIERNGQVIGGVLFNVFEGADVHVSVAGRGFTAGFLAEVGHYVFDTLKCERMTAITEKPEIVRIAERLGGEVEGLLRNHFGNTRHGFVVGILKEDWKF